MPIVKAKSERVFFTRETLDGEATESKIPQEASRSRSTASLPYQVIGLGGHSSGNDQVLSLVL